MTKEVLIADVARLEAQIPEAREKERELWLTLKSVEKNMEIQAMLARQAEDKARSDWSRASLNLECLQRVVEAFKVINQGNHPVAPEPAAERRLL